MEPLAKPAILKTPNSGIETVLVVEDEKALLDMKTAMLELKGYNVLPASNAAIAESLTIQNVGKINLLLTDVFMPDINGKDLAAKLLIINPNMKVLYMSGYSAEIISKQGLLQTNHPFLQKPFSMEALLSKINEVLENHL